MNFLSKLPFAARVIFLILGAIGIIIFIYLFVTNYPVPQGNDSITPSVTVSAESSTSLELVSVESSLKQLETLLSILIEERVTPDQVTAIMEAQFSTLDLIRRIREELYLIKEKVNHLELMNEVGR